MDNLTANKENPASAPTAAEVKTFSEQQILNAYLNLKATIIKASEPMDSEKTYAMWTLLSLLNELKIVDDAAKLAEFGACSAAIHKFI